MNKLISIGCKAQSLLNSTCAVDFLGPLALRLYLVPILWMAGTKKLADIDSISEWFGNPDWGLGLPFPDLMAWLATLTEVGGGAVLLFFGLATRWISIPLIVTMMVAAVSVHWQNGWLALAEGSGFLPQTEPKVLSIAWIKLKRSYRNTPIMTGSQKMVIW